MSICQHCQHCQPDSLTETTVYCGKLNMTVSCEDTCPAFLSTPEKSDQPMSPDDMWNQLVDRHPSFGIPSNVVKLTARGLRKLIDQAWDNGLITGINGVPDDEQPDTQELPNESIFDIFNEFFRKEHGQPDSETSIWKDLGNQLRDLEEKIKSRDKT